MAALMFQRFLRFRPFVFLFAGAFFLGAFFFAGVFVERKTEIYRHFTSTIKTFYADYLRSKGQIEQAARLLYLHDDIAWIDRDHPHTFEVNPKNLIRTQGPDDVFFLRNELKHYIWKNNRIDKVSKYNIEVIENHRDDRYDDIEDLDKIDLLKIENAYGFDSYVYHFWPKEPLGGVLIYHQGHRGDVLLGKEVISRFLASGYMVFGFAMPLLGSNPGAIIDVPRFGPIRFAPGTSHNAFHFLDDENFSSLEIFLNPVMRVLDYIEEKFEVSCVAMTGISGGGWTTNIIAAIEPRVCYSYPVAGSLPIYLRFIPPNEALGDYEFTQVVDFYRIANYLDLYVLAATGHGRRHVQILNVYDSDVFQGRSAAAYRGAVQEAVMRTGSGSFDIFFDVTHAEHTISSAAIEFMLQDIEQYSSAPP